MFWLRSILSLLLVTLVHLGSGTECATDIATPERGSGSYSTASIEGLPAALQTLHTSLELPATLRVTQPLPSQLRSSQSPEPGSRKHYSSTVAVRPSGSWLSAVGSRYILSFFADPAPARIRVALCRLRI